jgi:Pentapeptide repeats (8 copies)
MPEERQFPQGSRVDDLDLSGVHLHGTNFEGARLTETYLMDADISGDIEGLRLNGVEIEPLVRAELDRRYPDRVKLRASDVAGLREAWSMVERLWAATTWPSPPRNTPISNSATLALSSITCADRTSRCRRSSRKSSKPAAARPPPGDPGCRATGTSRAGHERTASGAGHPDADKPGRHP